MTKLLDQKIVAATEHIKKTKDAHPKIGIVLGSGLGAFVDLMKNKTTIPYSDIPYFKTATVKGHDGKLVLGTIDGVEIVALQGRFHLYEGYELDDVVFPVRVLAALGIKILIVTNAAGGINYEYLPGDLMLIEDHLNLTGRNPLVGPNDESIGPRFPDMTDIYSNELITLLEASSRELKIKIHKGVYAGVLGPSYETPAEIKMLRILGGDAVGMSTIFETIVANHIGLKICGISCITNMGAGMANKKLNHDHIKEEALKAMDNFTNLLTCAINKFKRFI